MTPIKTGATPASATVSSATARMNAQCARLALSTTLTRMHVWKRATNVQWNTSGTTTHNHARCAPTAATTASTSPIARPVQMGSS